MWKRPECIPRSIRRGYRRESKSQAQVIWICVLCIGMCTSQGLVVRAICEHAMHPLPAGITNSAEPGDPATRVCCGNHSVCASLPSALSALPCAENSEPLLEPMAHVASGLQGKESCNTRISMNGSRFSRCPLCA
jgi:hypothetical protein